MSAPESLPAHHPGDDEIDLTELFNALLQNIWLVIGIFVVVLSVGLGYAIVSAPVYEADALIQVEDKRSGVAGLAGLSQLSESLGIQQSSIAGEIEILRSREVLYQAIRTTRADMNIQVDNRFPLIGDWMTRRYESGVDAEPGLAPAFLGLESYAWGGERLELGELDLPARVYILEITQDGFRVNDEDGAILLEDKRLGERLALRMRGHDAYLSIQALSGRPGTRFRIDKKSTVRTYEALRSALSVTEAGKQSQVIRLSLEHTDRRFAEEFVNAVAAAYLKQNVERRSEEARRSLAFLEEQLPRLKHDVEIKEEELARFRSSSGTISITDETRGLLDQAIKLENERLSLELKRNELIQLYKPEHPRVRTLDQQHGALLAARDQLGLSIDALPEAQRDLLRLERDAQVNTQLYISLLNNAQELRVAEAGTIGNVRIIDFAVHPERPVKPKRLLIVAVAGLLGGFLGMLAALLKAFLRPAIQRPDQLEQRTGLTIYATLPESDDQKKFNISATGRRRSSGHRPQVLAYARPDDPAVESLRSMRTGLQFALMGTTGKTIAITSATADVGKSFITSNLAAILASSDKHVLVINADLRRPNLHEFFGYDGKQRGLTDILLGHVQFEDARLRINDQLDVLAAGTRSPNPGDLLLDRGLAGLLEQLEATYDHVLIDTAPLLPVADTLAIMKHVAAAFLVVRAEQSTLSEVRDAMARLRTAGVDEPMKGVIFNGVRRFRLGYGTSYRYYYAYK